MADNQKLSARQRKFCQEYLVSGNGTDAAIKAGYSKKTARTQASKLLTKGNIKNYLDKAMERIHTKKTASAQEVIEYLTSVMRGEQKEQVLKATGDGVQRITEIDVSARDRIKCAELLGKRYSIWTEKVDLTVEPVVLVDDVKE